MPGLETSLWEALEPSSSGLPDSEPAGRCGHVAVASGDGRRLIVIGGYNPEGVLSDAWEFHLERREWDRISVTGVSSPPERTFFRGCAGPPLPSATLPQPQGTDAGEGEEGLFAYVFGGVDAEGNATNAVWCLDVDNRTWHEVYREQEQGLQQQDGASTRMVAPCARSNHAMCRAGGVLAVHGGESSSGALLGDVWFFHPTSATWKEEAGDAPPTSAAAAAAAAGPSPCPRSSHCLTFAARSADGSATTSSSSAGTLVLFGGLGHADGFEEETMPLNDLWVLHLTAAAVALGPGSGGGASDGEEGEVVRCVWSSVMLDGVGPSPRSLAAIVAPSQRHGNTGSNNGADLFLFGGYGLVELSSGGMVVDEAEEEEEEEGGEIIMAYIDDLWRLSLESDGADADGFSPSEWVNETGMGFAGESIVEGRNGHTLTWCGEKLVLFGGFVGDGFDAGVHVAEPPSSTD
ncbi:unnamed protein product [Ectocarpus sp. 12 AP-2014]